MITYNWKAVDRYCNSDPLKVYKLFDRMSKGILSAKDASVIKTKPTDSFLLNYRELLTSKVSKLEIYHYIRLASKRNYADYLLSGITGLHISLCDSNVKNFNIIKQDNDYIKFIYEN